jgi:hypothetical protein
MRAANWNDRATAWAGREARASIKRDIVAAHWIVRTSQPRPEPAAVHAATRFTLRAHHQKHALLIQATFAAVCALACNDLLRRMKPTDEGSGDHLGPRHGQGVAPGLPNRLYRAAQEPKLPGH